MNNLHPLFRDILGRHGMEQTRYDSQEPVDNRTDDEIERDIEARLTEQRNRQRAIELEQIAEKNAHLWDMVDEKRKLGAI